MIPPKLTLAKVTNSKIDYEFIANIAFRFCKIFMRSNKNIKLIYSNFSNKHHFGDNLTVVNFRFRNAILYKLDHITTHKRQFVIQKTYTQKKLTVYGFFRKKSYVLNFNESDTDDSRFCIEENKFLTLQQSKNLGDASA